MLASDIVQICNEPNGVLEVARMFQLSRRQAGAFEVAARRALASGSNPILAPGDGSPLLGPRGAQGPATGTVDGDDQDQGANDLETAARAQARRIKAESQGLRDHSVAQLRGRIRTLERNLEKGYGEWSYDLALSRRIVALVEGIHA
jgi:hypothetical protein